jgi:hypothetical protein
MRDDSAFLMDDQKENPMWKITIGPFRSRDEAEYWKASKVKKKDWHPAIVEEVKEEDLDPKDRSATEEKDRPKHP